MLFDNYKKKSSLNQKVPRWRDGGGEFVRKGEIGDWVNHFDQETNRYQTLLPIKGCIKETCPLFRSVFWPTSDADNSDNFKFCVARDMRTIGLHVQQI